jgi:ABC-type Na+ efflux pump permease subunit
MMLKNLILTLLALGWAAILFLVGGRFLLLLADANTSSELVERIYRHSDFWVKPFFNMFDLANKTVEETGGVFEPASLIAFIVYFVIGLLVIGAVQFATGAFTHGGHGHPAHDV